MGFCTSSQVHKEHVRFSAQIMCLPCLCRTPHLQAMQASVRLQYKNSPWSGARDLYTQKAKTVPALVPSHTNMPFMRAIPHMLAQLGSLNGIGGGI